MHNKKFLNSRIGFTLLELIIVIGIFALIMGSLGLALSGFLEGRSRETHAAELRQTLRQAQAYAMARYGQSPWGVYFDQNQNRFILFKGTSFSNRDASFDRETRLRSPIYFGTVQIQGGGSEIVFSPVKGETAQPGLMELRQGSDVTALRINAYGQIEIEN